MNLLLVEDDETVVETIRLCFRIYEPTLKLAVAGNGEDAIQKLMQGDFDGVIVDLGLPDIDGTEVIAQLRAFSQKPVIVVSARSTPESIAKSIALGANDYVIKPFDAWELLEHFNKLFKII